MVRLTARDSLPGLREIEEAEGRIRKYIPPTPLERSPGVSELTGRETLLKLESFQPIRVFKIRGALNKLILLGDSALKRGVVTASSGNHGLAIAYACRQFGVRAVVCVPENANPQKLGAIEEQDAEIVKFGPGYDYAYEHALEIARRRRLTFVHAFNDRDVIAGQGTCGLEMARQAPDLDSAVVAIGGGGLISGVAIALKNCLRGVRVYGAETTAIPSMYESVEEGRLVRVKPGKTIADGMQAAVPGELTFRAVSRYVDKIGLVEDSQIERAILDLVKPGKTIADGMQAAVPGELTFLAVSRYVDRIGLVEDSEIERAIFNLLVRARVVAEPAGASPLAAIVGPLRKEKGEKVALVVSGGNISLDLLAKIIRRKSRA